MNVTIFNKYYYPHVGGIETVVAQHAELLAALPDINVTVVCFKNHKDEPRVSYERGVRVFRYPPLFKLSNLPVSLTYIFQVFLKSLSSDVVIGHYPFPLYDFSVFLFSPLIRKRKFLLVWHSEIVKQRFLKRLINPFTKNVMRKSTVIYTSTDLERFSDFSAFSKDTKVIPLSLNIENYSPEDSGSIPELMGINKPFILFFGRLTIYKNIELFLKLADDHFFSDYYFVVCGSGENVKDLKRSVSKGKIIWVDRFLNHDEKCSVFRSATVYAFTSNLPNEAFGITQLESLALGTPVVNMEVPSGVPSVTRGLSCCYTARLNDYLDFRKGLAKVIACSNLESVRNSCRDHVIKNFSDSVVEREFVKVVRGESDE